MASYLDARAAGGTWLVRVEDIDPPREVAGASEAIIESLRRHELHWDEEVCYQSTRHDAYSQALQRLRTRGLVFDCVCTRATLGPGGSCGERCAPRPGEPCAQRLRISGALPTFSDLIRGAVSTDETPADVVLWRKDGLPAYALAVVVDDHWQQITTVLRGSDLLEQTPVQRYLFECLEVPAPQYAHVPLVLGEDGRKLSKQNGAAPIDDATPLANLRQALALLKQPAAQSNLSSPQALLARAVEQWHPHP